MGFDKLRAELRDFYGNILDDRADAFNVTCVAELERRYKHAKACWEKAMKLSPAECAVYGAYGRGVKFAEKVFNERRKFPENE